MKILFFLGIFGTVHSYCFLIYFLQMFTFLTIDQFQFSSTQMEILVNQLVVVSLQRWEKKLRCIVHLAMILIH